MRGLGISLFVILLFSCSSKLPASLKNTKREYEQLIRDELLEDRVYSSAKLLLSVKVLPFSKKLQEQQELLSPGLGIRFKPGYRSVLVALNTVQLYTMQRTEWKLSFSGQESRFVEEIVDPATREQFYSFSVPYYRLFRVDFDATETEDVGELLVRVPGAQIRFPKVSLTQFEVSYAP